MTIMIKEEGTVETGREEGQHWVTEWGERGGDMEMGGGGGWG